MPQTRQAALTIQLHPVPVADPLLHRALEGLRAEVQQYLQLLAERADTTAGLRGTPEFFADIQARGHRIRGMGRAIHDDDAQQRGQSLNKTEDGLNNYDALGGRIVNMGDGEGERDSASMRQLERRARRLLTNPTFTGLVTLVNLLATGTLTHTGAAVGFLGAMPAAQQAAIAALTDGTGATANNAIENVPAATGDAGGAATVSAAAAVATVASVNAALTAIENNIADLTAKVNALAAVPRTFGFIAP